MKPKILFTPKQAENQFNSRVACFTQLVPLIESRARVYFTDESMFTSKQAEVKTWMLPGDAMTGSVRDQLGFKAVAVCSFEDVNGRIVSTYTTE